MSFDPIHTLQIALDDPASTSLTPRLQRRGPSLHYLLDCAAPWQVEIMRLSRAKWVCFPVLTVPWLTVDGRYSGTWTFATSLPDTLMKARQRLTDPGLSLQEIHLTLQTQAQVASQRFHPLQQYLEFRARRFGLVMAVESLPAGRLRDVAIALVEGGFDSTPEQLLATARAIAA